MTLKKNDFSSKELLITSQEISIHNVLLNRKLVYTMFNYTGNMQYGNISISHVTSSQDQVFAALIINFL